VLPLHNPQHEREQKSPSTGPSVQTKKDLREMEKATLIRALEEAKWKVSGPQGAAQKLGVPASTLSSRIKALGIQRPE